MPRESIVRFPQDGSTNPMYPGKPTWTVNQAAVGVSAARPVCVWLGTEPRSGCPFHDHDYTEITMVCGGSAVHVTPESETELHAGSVVVVATGGIPSPPRPRCAASPGLGIGLSYARANPKATRSASRSGPRGHARACRGAVLPRGRVGARFYAHNVSCAYGTSGLGTRPS